MNKELAKKLGLNKAEKGKYKIRRINAKKFHRMSAAEKRVAIAKDVLARLAAKAIEAKRGIFLEPVSRTLTAAVEGSYVKDRFTGYEDFHYPDPKIAHAVKSIPGQEFVETNRCAVCAKGALVLSWAANFNKVTTGQIWNKAVVNGLAGVFPKKMRDEMEDAFEYRSWSLSRIMKNIVVNEGKFVGPGPRQLKADCGCGW